MVAIPKKQNDTAQLIYLAYQNQSNDGFRAHLGASLIGDKCRRKLWYTFHWCTRVRHSGRLLRLFERGQDEELRFADDLRAIGCDVHTVDPETGKQFRFKAHGGHFGGSMDAACYNLPEAPKKWHVVEMKTSNDKGFKALCKDGVEKSKPLHYAQMQVYMGLSGMTRALYLAVNKNDDSIYTERLHFSKVDFELFMEKAGKIISAPEPLERISEKPDWYECLWCDYHAICHGQALPEVNCRTCAHSTPLNTGQWVCEYNNCDVLSLEDQKHGCNDHLYNPALVSFAEMMSFNKDKGVKYCMADGRVFYNSTRHLNRAGCYTSMELKTIDPAMIDDKQLDSIRVKFNAEVM